MRKYSILFALIVFSAAALTNIVGASDQIESASFLLFIAEQRTPVERTWGWWEQTPFTDYGFAAKEIARELNEARFVVLHPTELTTTKDSRKLLTKLRSLNKKELSQLGKAFGADFLAVGEAKVGYRGFIPGGAAIAVEASVSVRVFSVRSSQWIASSQHSALAAYPLLEYASYLAIRNAATKVGKSLSRALRIHPEVKKLIQLRLGAPH